MITGLSGIEARLADNPADEDATIWSAYQQLQTYKDELGALLAWNALLVILAPGMLAISSSHSRPSASNSSSLM